MSRNDTIKKLTAVYRERVQQIRRQIHTCPEISYEEEQTAALVANELKAMGIEVKEHIAGGHGVLGIIRGSGEGKTVALRADMDALSIREETGLSFASTIEGKMHACGHDAHTAMVLGAAHVLQDMRESFHGTVLLIFQPAEEKTPDGGAKAIVASGVLGKADAVYGLHVWPQLPTGTVGIKAGPMMAASDRIVITITGKSSHAAMPHKGIDAIAAAGQFITAAQQIISRQIDPLHPAVLTFGKIYGGSRYNIVAGDVTIEGTCRTYHKDTQDYIEHQLQQLLQGIDTSFGTTSELQYKRGYDAVVITPEQAGFVTAVAKDILGEDAVAAVTEPAMTAEDFSGYLAAYTGAFLWLGAHQPGSDIHPLHNSRFTIDEACLPIGVEMLTALALATLSD